jgi:integrase
MLNSRSAFAKPPYSLGSAFRRCIFGYEKTFKTVWHATLRRAKVGYFRICDLRSTYATRLSAGGVADEWVKQLLRQGDAKVFKKYSQMEVADEARSAHEVKSSGQRRWLGFCHSPAELKGF